MKLIVLFIGLFSLIFSYNGRCHTNPYLNLPDSTISYWVEDDQSNDIQGIEKTETLLITSYNNQLSVQKKRDFGSTTKSLNSSDLVSNLTYKLNIASISKINLFLIYHFTLSLWQIFLQ